MGKEKFSFAWMKRKKKKHEYTVERTSSREVGKSGEFVHRYVMPSGKRERWLMTHYPENAEQLIFDNAGQKTSAQNVANDPERRKKARVLMLVSVAVALLLLLSYPIAKLVSSSLVITDVEIIGCDFYSVEEVLDAGGLAIGDGLPVFDKDVIEELTVLTLPYIESCKVNVEFPNKLIYELDEAKAVAYTKISGEYYALSESLRVLERSEESKTFENLIYIELPRASSAIVGDSLKFDIDVNTDYIAEFLNLLSESKLKTRVNKIFLEEKFNIVFTVDGRFRVRLGSPKEHMLKFEIVNKLIEENGGKTEYAIIDVTIPQKSGIKYETRLDIEARD